MRGCGRVQVGELFVGFVGLREAFPLAYPDLDSIARTAHCVPRAPWGKECRDLTQLSFWRPGSE